MSAAPAVELVKTQRRLFGMAFGIDGYMDEVSGVLISTALGFIGTIVGASITWRVTKRASATAATLRLYEEWNSESMLVTRHGVQEVREFFDRDENNTLDSRYRSLSPEQRASIWKIIFFYEKLYVMIENDQCNKKLIPDLFGEESSRSCPTKRASHLRCITRANGLIKGNSTGSASGQVC
ncbi:MAG: hypothetical protein L6Q49_09515 [Anaerolineales bacterium]|nr:hypothetical protein [Anaerolineales bacterium]